jgi:hypothetical protein
MRTYATSVVWAVLPRVTVQLAVVGETSRCDTGTDSHEEEASPDPKRRDSEFTPAERVERRCQLHMQCPPGW